MPRARLFNIYSNLLHACLFIPRSQEKKTNFPINLCKEDFQMRFSLPQPESREQDGLWKEFKWEERWGASSSFTGVVPLKELPDLLVSLVTVEETQKDSGDWRFSLRFEGY